MAAVAILDFKRFIFVTVGTVSVPNFVEIAQTAAEIWRFWFFQDGGREGRRQSCGSISEMVQDRDVVSYCRPLRVSHIWPIE